MDFPAEIAIIAPLKFLTAIDLLGQQATKLDDWSHQVVCPWCGEEGWVVADYFQCHNEACETQTASPLDFVAHFKGGHEQAAHFVAQRRNIPLDMPGARRRMRERAILDTWLNFCQTPPTTEAQSMTNRLEARGFGIKQSGYNAIVLDGRQMKSLVQLAKETGAEYPDNWNQQAPGPSRVFCVQTRPHTIDRLLVMDQRGRVSQIIWNEYAAGFVSLIGLSPRRPKLVVADIEQALKLQHELSIAGVREEVSAVFADFYSGDACPRWEVQSHLLTAVPRHVAPQSTPDFYGPEDLPRMQQALDQFPGLERSVKALPIDWVAENRPREAAKSWGSLRRGLISSLIPTRVTQMPADAASILEQTGTRSEDVTRMIARFRKLKRHAIADDIELLALTKVISRDGRSVVKETANDYRKIAGADTTILANFSLKVGANVTFVNQNAERYCQATLRCGNAVTDVLFPQAYFHDQIKTLEAELQRQLTTAGDQAKAGLSPTVIEVNDFRKRVIPHLRAESARAPAVDGVDRLGWSDSRKRFTFPGFVVSLDGARKTSSILCPTVPVLKRFKAVKAKEWAEECPQGLDRSCQDMVAIMVASTVRYFRRCATRPIMIAQSSEAMTVLDKLMLAFGQQDIYEINHNTRDTNRIEGVHGYPFVAAGPRQAGLATAQVPYLHLTDQGYKFPTEPDPLQAEAAARAAQFCMRRVVEWCLSTGGDEFKESPSVAHYRSLLREGQWLIENVCKQEDWEVSEVEPTALEELLAQVPFEEASQRMTLIDGTELHVDIKELRRDHDGILRETKEMGGLVAIEDDLMVGPAARLMPAIGNFYGQDPDVAVVTT